MRYTGSLLVLLLLATTPALAQDCGQNLEDSRRAFYDGRFDQVITLLEPCHTRFESVADKTASLELLTKASLMLNETDKAETYMKALLTTNPLFTVREGDLIVFKRLFEQFEIRTRYTLGFEAGFNQPQFQVLQYNSYAGISDQSGGYTASPGLSLGLSYEYAINKNIFAGAKLLYQQHGYTMSETLLDYQRLTVNERLSYLDVPIQVIYQVNKWKKWKPFISAGMSFHLLMSSNARIDLFSIDQNLPIQINPNAYSTDRYDLSNQRKGFAANYVFGAGVRKPMGLWSVQVAVNYEYGLNNLANPANRYADPVLLNTYSYVSDDFKMNQLRFTVGLVRTFSYPKKIN